MCVDQSRRKCQFPPIDSVKCCMMSVPFEGWDETVTDIVVDFAEVAIHALLHARRIYPQDIFERRRKYGVPVWMSRHPELNDYICQVLLRAKVLIAEGVVRNIAVCMFGDCRHRGQGLLEKVAFSISVDREGDGNANDGHDDGKQMAQKRASPSPTISQELKDQLRSAILQIEKSSAHLPMRHGCTFALHVEAHDEQIMAEGGDEDEDGGEGATVIQTALRRGNWLLAESDAQGALVDGGQRHLIPIKSVRGAGLRLDVSTEMGDYLDNDT